jgi:hypothetical protein
MDKTDYFCREELGGGREAVWLPVKTAVNNCFVGQLRATEKGENSSAVERCSGR